MSPKWPKHGGWGMPYGAPYGGAPMMGGGMAPMGYGGAPYGGAPMMQGGPMMAPGYGYNGAAYGEFKHQNDMYKHQNKAMKELYKGDMKDYYKEQNKMAEHQWKHDTRYGGGYGGPMMGGGAPMMGNQPYGGGWMY